MTVLTQVRTLIYLDWNVFNRLEKLDTLRLQEQPIYRTLNEMLLCERFIVPYSNAHIRDLARGYVKDDRYAEGHLNNITRITKDYCVTQYWGEESVRWHYRDPVDFLQEAVTELRKRPPSLSSLFDIEGVPEAKVIWDAQREVLEKVSLDDAFSKITEADTVFDLMFPRAREKKNLLALMEDILTLSYVMGTDYGLYKRFRKYLTNAQQNIPGMVEIARSLMPDSDVPKQLDWESICDAVPLKGPRMANADYDKIFDAFTLTDLKGYRSDERFSNLIDDALYCFYAAHGAFFITLDGRCYDKSKSVYQQLGITTTVATPAEFILLFQEA